MRRIRQKLVPPSLERLTVGRDVFRDDVAKDPDYVSVGKGLDSDKRDYAKE